MLLKQLVDFVEVEGHFTVLKQRVEARRAVERMLEVVADLLDGVCEYLSRSRIGELIQRSIHPMH